MDANLLKTLVESAPAGVVICEANASNEQWQAIYVNPAMEKLTGYNADAMLGRSLRFLQADDRDQDGLVQIRTALRDGTQCQTMLRNYRRDGSLFCNEVTLVPLRSANGRVTHFASFHREGGTMRPDLRGDARDPAMNTQTMLAYLRDDKSTGLLRRPYFEELIKRDWGLAQRESRRLSFLLFDLDHFAQYREIFGKPGAERSFRRVARVVAGCFRRASDLCGRLEADQIAALTTGIDLSQASKLAETVLGRIRELAIHHPRAGNTRYLTASAGVISVVPSHNISPARVYEDAARALLDAKELGCNRVMSRECE